MGGKSSARCRHSVKVAPGRGNGPIRKGRQKPMRDRGDCNQLTGTNRVEREERATTRFGAGIIRTGRNSKLRVPKGTMAKNVK